MQLIEIPGSGNRVPISDEAAQHALAGLIASIGTSSFGTEGLASLNLWMPFCWWSIYRLSDCAPPSVHAMGSFRVRDGTVRSWRVYRESLYRRDETFRAVREELRQKTLLLMHWNAREIPYPHRAEIYSRNELQERLSIVTRDAGDALLAVNLYRHESQHSFRDDEIDVIGRFSLPLMASVQRHIALDNLCSPRQDVLEPLTPRERQVCERLLKGWTHDGIAADLGLSSTTVKTYRDRAFERLRIRYRHQLFALVLDDAKQLGSTSRRVCGSSSVRQRLR